jgi:Zn-dependent protease
MLFRLSPEVLILLIPVLVFALVFHEFSHAWVANQLGDPTAKYAGRLTLNPLAHLDIFGSLMILFVGFGWAKPVPVDSRYLGNPRIDMMKIAFIVRITFMELTWVPGAAADGGEGDTWTCCSVLAVVDVSMFPTGVARASPRVAGVSVPER